MSKQMITAILIIAATFAAESELKLWVGNLCASTNCALMTCNWCAITILCAWWCSLSSKFCTAMNILWIVALQISCHHKENKPV